MSKTVERAETSKSDAASRRAGGRWKLEDAKARFSEVVRLARSEGPQRVSVRGRDAVVVISVEQLEQLAPRKPMIPFVKFMESLHLSELDLTREQDRGRDDQL
jgi:antitoxin Phd